MRIGTEISFEGKLLKIQNEHDSLVHSPLYLMSSSCSFWKKFGVEHISHVRAEKHVIL